MQGQRIPAACCLAKRIAAHGMDPLRVAPFHALELGAKGRLPSLASLSFRSTALSARSAPGSLPLCLPPSAAPDDVLKRVDAPPAVVFGRDEPRVVLEIDNDQLSESFAFGVCGSTVWFKNSLPGQSHCKNKLFLGKAY